MGKASNFDLSAPEPAPRFDAGGDLTDGTANPDIGTAAALISPAEFELLRTREQELMEILGCSSPEQILHCVRNLQNNVTLLKALLTKKDRHCG